MKVVVAVVVVVVLAVVAVVVVVVVINRRYSVGDVWVERAYAQAYKHTNFTATVLP